MVSESHHRTPAYVTISTKGLQAEISQYFKEKYNEKRKGDFKYWVEVPSQFVVGVAAIIALLISGNESCNKSEKNKPQTPVINIYNRIPETISSSNRPANKPNYDTVDGKIFYLDTFYIGVDTVYK